MPSNGSIPIRAIRFIRYIIDGGPLNKFYEWRLGINTKGLIKLPTLGISNPECIEYYASGYRTLKKVFSCIKIRPKKDVFLDYGSGMGRVVILAATFPFRRVIGVEISSYLNERALENLRCAQRKKKLKCQEIELVNNNAALYKVPLDVSLIYFYNPFFGTILSDVMENIRTSLIERPRPLVIVFHNTEHFDSYHCDWLAEDEEFSSYMGKYWVKIFKNKKYLQNSE